MLGHLNGTEEDIFLSELHDLLLNEPALRISIWVAVSMVLTSMVFLAMTRGISEENSKSSFCLPILIKPLFKASSYVLWSITTTKRSKSFYELFAHSDVTCET